MQLFIQSEFCVRQPINQDFSHSLVRMAPMCRAIIDMRKLHLQQYNENVLTLAQVYR